MSNHTLLECLKDKRVQALISIAIKEAGCCTTENIIEKITQKLSIKKEGPSKWVQIEINL